MDPYSCKSFILMPFIKIIKEIIILLIDGWMIEWMTFNAKYIMKHSMLNIS